MWFCEVLQRIVWWFCFHEKNQFSGAIVVAVGGCKVLTWTTCENRTWESQNKNVKSPLWSEVQNKIRPTRMAIVVAGEKQNCMRKNVKGPLWSEAQNKNVQSPCLLYNMAYPYGNFGHRWKAGCEIHRHEPYNTSEYCTESSKTDSKHNDYSSPEWLRILRE